jgi:NAD+--asparagine ADP-ribosyltransferase
VGDRHDTKNHVISQKHKGDKATGREDDMANNRMYLKHTATGKDVKIAKRYGDGMYCVPQDILETLETFFAECEATNEPWDGYELEFEVEPGSGF